jgi:hypothetical protein
MNDPPVNPQEVFQSQLPVGASLIVIFVPSRDQDGQLIDQEYWVGRITQGFVSSKATETDMATTVAHMTKSELR